jgi:hypothetical protein
MLNRELFYRAGGFCEDSQLRGMEDYDLWLRVAQLEDFCYIPQALAIYSRSPDSLSSNASKLSQCRSMSLILRRTAALVDKNDLLLRAALQMQSDACSRVICDTYLQKHLIGEFAVHLGEFWLQHPAGAAKYIASKVTRRPTK